MSVRPEDQDSPSTARTVRTVDGAPDGLLSLAGKALRRKGDVVDLPAVEYRRDGHRVDADRLIAYQKLCGFAVSCAVPSTFVHVQAFPLSTALMSARDFPLPLLGLVHVRNRITQARAIDADETLDLRVWAEGLREHPAGRQVDIRAEARVGDETVWHGTSTYLQRAPRTDTRDPRPDNPPPPPAVAYWRLPADLGRRYAAVSGDPNPIHLSRLTAKAFGFPRAIAHGMWLNAQVLGALESRLPDAYTVDVAFKTPTFLPSVVAFAADRTDDGWALGVHNARSGKPHLAATIQARPAPALSP